MALFVSHSSLAKRACTACQIGALSVIIAGHGALAHIALHESRLKPWDPVLDCNTRHGDIHDFAVANVSVLP
jgi:hypothetical protein